MSFGLFLANSASFGHGTPLPGLSFAAVGDERAMRITPGQRTFRRSLIAATAFVAIGFIVPRATLRAQAGLQGRWTTLSALMPINPVHVTLMHTGKVLVVSGSGNVATETNYQAAVWDPQTDMPLRTPRRQPDSKHIERRKAST
jgi:hypothetical protein